METALLDTDTLSEVLKQRNPQVVAKASAYFRAHGSSAFSAFSAFTRFEISRGFKEKQAANQLARFNEFCQHSLIIPVTDSVLERAEDLWAIARRSGMPCSDADLIIAATALDTERVLVTGNKDHYSWISSLTLEDWRNP